MRLEEDIDKNNTVKDQNICRNQLDERSEDLVDKVLMELEIKEFSDKGNDRASLSQNFTTSQQDLGLQQNQEGLITPRFGRAKRKRGRKSSKELREAEGLNRDQIKIDNLFYTGKGKCLPRTP